MRDFFSFFLSDTVKTTRDPTGVHKTLCDMPVFHRAVGKKAIDMKILETGLRSVLDVDRRGGRLFQRDDETVILVDCSSFTSEQIECLQTVYPHLRVTVLQSEASLSGFLVVFQLASPAFKRTAALLVLNLGIFTGGLYALWLAYSKQLTP